MNMKRLRSIAAKISDAGNTSTQIPKLALRPDELARAFGVSRRTICEWTSRGLLPCIRQGRVVLYPVSLLQEWLARQIQSAVPQGNTAESDDDRC